MLNNKEYKQDQFTKKIYLTIILFVFIAMIIGCGAMYLTFKQVGAYIITSNNQESLRHISTTAKTITETGQDLVLQVFRDRDVIPLMYGTEPKANEISKAMIRLDAYRESMPYIHSIYVYNQYRDEFYTTLPSEGIQTSETFFDQDIVEFLKGERVYDLNYPIVREVEDRVRVMDEKVHMPVYSFIMYDGLYSSYADIYNAVIVNIDQRWMKELLNQTNKDQSDRIFIIDNKGVLLTDFIDNKILQDISQYTYIDKIINAQEKSGSFIEWMDGTQRLISYATVDDLSNWIFVMTNKYSELLQPLENIRNAMLIVIIIGISITSLVGKIASEKLYRPVRQLENYIRELKKEKKQESYNLKQAFLVKMIKESLPYSKQMIDADFKRYRINLDTNLSSKIILISMDHYKDFTRQQNKEYQDLMRYALVNISEEIGNNKFLCNVVDLSNGFFVSIINSASSWTEAELDRYVEDYIEELKKTIKQLLNISVSCIVSESIEDFSLIPEIYEEVSNANKYKIFYTEQCTIYTRNIRGIEEKSYTYSDKEYNLLLMNLKQGKIEDATINYKNIIDYTSQYSYMAYQSTILHIAYSVNLMIAMLNDNKVKIFEHHPSQLIKKIVHAEYSYEVDRIFMDLFEQIGEFITSIDQNKTEKDYNELIQSIYKILNEQYTDIDICVQSIAAELKMSAPYIGRIFSTCTGNTITQYINDKRIEKASSMLINTHQSITDISDACGFSNITYFYKKFKKATGFTPTIYKEIYTNKVKEKIE